MFGVREGNKKGNDPQHQHNDSDQHESFHEMSPKT
jgi:hypothetical protein